MSASGGMEKHSLHLELFFLAKMSLFLAATEPFLLNELVLIQEFGKNAAE